MHTHCVKSIKLCSSTQSTAHRQLKKTKNISDNADDKFVFTNIDTYCTALYVTDFKRDMQKCAFPNWVDRWSVNEDLDLCVCMNRLKNLSEHMELQLFRPYCVGESGRAQLTSPVVVPSFVYPQHPTLHKPSSPQC